MQISTIYKRLHALVTQEQKRWMSGTCGATTKNKKGNMKIWETDRRGLHAPFTVLMVVYFAFIPTLGTFYSHVGNK